LNLEFAKTLADMDKAMASMRTVEIVGLPKNDQFISADQTTQGLRGHAGEFATCCDLAAPQFMNFEQGFFQWVGFTMRDSELKEEEAIEAVITFAKLAAEREYKVYARDLPSEVVVQTAIAMGVCYIFGRPSTSKADMAASIF